MNLEEPWLLTSWSALKSSSVAEVRSELAHAAVCQSTCGHAFGAVQVR